MSKSTTNPKKRKSVPASIATTSSVVVSASKPAAAKIVLPEIPEIDEFVIYSDDEGRFEAVEDDVTILTETLLDFYVAKIRFYKKGYLAMRKGQSGKVFDILLKNHKGYEILLEGSVSGDGGWHQTHYHVTWKMPDAVPHGLVSTMYFEWDDEKNYFSFRSYEKSNETAEELVKLVGLDKKYGVIFYEQAANIAKVFMRRAYAICKKEQKEVSEAEREEKEARVIDLMCESMEIIGRHTGIRD
jgi:hypothetical protein